MQKKSTKFVKLQAAAKNLGLTYSCLRSLARDGKIPAFRTGGDKGTWMVDLDQVRDALRKQSEVQLLTYSVSTTESALIVKEHGQASGHDKAA